MRYPRPYINPGAANDQRQPIATPGTLPGDIPGEEIDSAKLVQRANRRIVADLLEASGQNREPAGCGERARAALELIQGNAAAGRITQPPQQREHPFDQKIAGAGD